MSQLPGTEALTWEGDLAARMVDGIRQDLLARTATARKRRLQTGTPTTTSLSAWRQWLQPRRRRLARMLGVGCDQRIANGQLRRLSAVDAADTAVARGPGFTAHAVVWPVFDGLNGEGLLLRPTGRSRAHVVCLADADQTPEQICGLAPGVPRKQQVARRLVENGCAVVVPQMVDRDCRHSATTGVDASHVIRATNMSHREFIYRAAYELGRHVIGYELETVFALLDAWHGQGRSQLPVGICGYGEGGRLALYAAALDARLLAAGVSGAFGPREDTWLEPIDRNVFGLLKSFGDAEVAAMIAPRRLIVEASSVPVVTGPPDAGPDRSGGAPGALSTPDIDSVAAEVERAARYVTGLRGAAGFIDLVRPVNGHSGSDGFVRAFVRALGARQSLAPPLRPARSRNFLPDASARRDRFVTAVIAHTQTSLAASEHRRAAFWSDADRTDAAAFARSAERYRQRLSRDVIGELPAPRGAVRPRSRQVYDTPAFRGYEIVLDLYGRETDPDGAHVFCYGLLLVPKRIRRGQQRPVVVCQHGLEGRPQDVADPAVDHEAYHTYACRLAERGFVTFAPQNPYIGGARYRDIQRLANPLGLSLFSVIVRQHERILQWLGGLPFVDAQRIAFYGLSYGGKTAMRVPALLPGYCLSICSADYNEWITKCVSTHHQYSYMGTGEYDMPEFDLGNTFNYAEMSWLIFPRPFMVERGHHDGVAPDEWVAYEYARTRRLYVLLGLEDHTRIEFFDGPHTINGIGTFEFLEEHLR